MKKLILIVAVLIIIASGWLIFGKNGEKSMVDSTNSASPSVSSETILPTVSATNTISPKTSPTASFSTQVKSFSVSASNFKFSLNEIKVKKGDRVRIIFKNDAGSHDWVIDEFDARTNLLKAGESETIEFTADKTGSFEYYCSVGSHRQMGMKGKLIVE